VLEIDDGPFAYLHAISMKRLSKIGAADDPSDGDDDESSMIF
jgi:hypothetical protein